MKRRQLLQSLAAAPAIAGLQVESAAAQAGAAPVAAVPVEDSSKLVLTAPDAAAGGVPRFLEFVERNALTRLCELIFPATGGLPGAKESGVPEFLSFLLSASPAAKQQLYRDGLAELNASARAKYAKPFAELTAEEAAPVLAPLTVRWAYPGPAEPFAAFLHTAKEEILQATFNSPEWAKAQAGRTRGASGTSYYWTTIE